MAQNIKIVLENVEKQTPNNVGFSDTITIKGDSKIALTSFNASFDINKTGQDILDQSFKMNLNQKEYDSERVVTIPDGTYYHSFELDIALIKETNKVFSAYEKDAPDPRVFTGYSVAFVKGSMLSSEDFNLTGDDANKTLISASVVKLSPFNFSQYLIDNGFTINDTDDYKGAVETLDENLDLDIYINNTTHESGASPMVLNEPDLASTYLMKGGGTCIQYNEKFNLKNLTLNSSVTMYDSNGNTMSLQYNTASREGDEETAALEFLVEKFVGGITTQADISNDFYNWDTSINLNRIKPTTGPWSATTKAAQDSYFLWCVRDGKWIIVFYDADDKTFHEVYTDGIAYNYEDNYTFRSQIQQVSSRQVIINANKVTATLADKKSGSAPFKTTFNFENAPRLREIYSFGIVFVLQPENNYQPIYIPVGPTDFYPSQDFEIACEIDTIKIKNYVGTKGNKNSGRKNIIAYFTPETTISQSSFIYRFDPSSPIYLAVDSKENIDFNSLNIRFINTYTNRTFSADTITCVLTNAP
jgi:hypothetical protein